MSDSTQSLNATCPLEPIFQFARRFIDLTEAERQIMQDTCSVRSYRKNDWICRSFDQNSNGFFVLRGTVVLLRASGDRELVCDIFLDGEPVIPVSSDPAGCEVYRLRCLDNCDIAESSAEETERNVREFPRFTGICREFAEEQLQKSKRFTEQLRLLPPRELYELVLRERPHLVQRVPQHVLANYLGITPETLSRIRKQIATR